MADVTGDQTNLYTTLIFYVRHQVSESYFLSYIYYSNYKIK